MAFKFLSNFLFISEFLIILFLIVLILAQKPGESEPMISGQVSTFDRADAFVVNLTKVFILLFFVNTLALIGLKRKIKNDETKRIERIVKSTNSIYDVK